MCAAACLTGSGCSPLELLDNTVPRCGYERFTDLAYGGLPRQRLDVYRPRSVRVGEEAPVVVFFYGGSWQSGSKDDYRFVAQAMASRGFVTVVPDYRLYPAVRFPAFVEDGAAAVRWTHENIDRFGGDRRRMHLMGHSAGAQIAVLLSLDPHYLENVGLSIEVIRATAALAGPHVLEAPTGDTAAALGATGGEPSSDRSFRPIAFAGAGAGAPPMLLIHGEDDEVVNPSASLQLAARLRESGGSARTITYDNLGHVGAVLSLAWPFRWLAPTLRDVTEFFREQGR